jgi:hypothetical protein
MSKDKKRFIEKVAWFNIEKILYGRTSVSLVLTGSTETVDLPIK